MIRGDTRPCRDAALKFLPEEFLEDAQKLERFRRETWSASAQNHPNICTIYEIGEHEGRLFIAMELVEGKTLAEKLKDGALPIEEVMSNSRQLSWDLEEAHAHHIVYRDLKPANGWQDAGAKEVRPRIVQSSAAPLRRSFNAAPGPRFSAERRQSPG